jgi:hypothetical protein
MKKSQLAVIAGLCLASLFLLSRDCGLTEKYKLARDDYNELKKITDADHALSLSRIEELTQAVGQANETIVQKEADIAVKNAKILVLSSRLDELIDNEPPTTPDIEAMPIVVNLRGRVAKLTEMFTLSQDVVSLQAEEITALKGKCIALESIGDEWKKSYEKEHILRVQAEGLFKNLERRVKSQGLLGKVKSAVIVGAAGYVAYSILKKK